jgi:hypothetical protein
MSRPNNHNTTDAHMTYGFYSYGGPIHDSLRPTVGLTISSFMRAMVFQSTTKFLPGSRWVLGSLLFIADNFGDLNLQDSESREVSLINEAQLGHGLVMLGKTDPDPLGDKADHTSVVPGAITDPIHQSSPESDSEGD